MMATSPPNWQTLNAYIDGELDVPEAADVALAAGSVASTADQISLLYHLKGGCHAAFPPAPADLASVLPPERPRRLPAVAAALLAVAIGTAAVAALGPWHQASTIAGGDVFAAAHALHRQWIANDLAAASDTPPVVLAALTQFGHLPMVPDLESTGLAVELVSVSDQPGGRLLQVGYRGHHGCHLSLFVFSGDRLPSLGGERLEVTERAHAWQVGDLAYLLFAKGMDTGRFDLIAEKVEHATRAKAPLDARARQELAKNKRQSASCQV